MALSRREFLGGLGAVAATTAIAPTAGHAFLHSRVGDLAKSPFKIAVINDEISQDFGHACEVVSRELGMDWIELRGMWNKNLLKLDSKEIEEARRILETNKLRVTDIASPLFKVDWPGAPKSKYSPKRDQFNADFTFEQQDEVLERSIAMAKAARKNVILVLENEPACNTATAAEAAKVLKDVTSRNLFLNWDPGNAAERGERPFPDGYNLLPKERIGHCHCKDAVKKPDGTGYEWAAVGRGTIDWVGQFKALKRDGYHLAVSLETHWRGAGTPEESTRQSWAGMKKALQEAAAI
jgi:L-ribulose-5-phosphate 3-epimerase